MILVDEEDQWLLDTYSWTINTQGYAHTHWNGWRIRLHHCIIGQPIPPLVTDHLDRNKLNNRRSNLRITTRTENYLNSEWSNQATYIYRQSSGSWYVEITRNRQRHYGGTYDTYAEAERARDELLDKISEQ